MLICTAIPEEQARKGLSRVVFILGTELLDRYSVSKRYNASNLDPGVSLGDI